MMENNNNNQKDTKKKLTFGYLLQSKKIHSLCWPDVVSFVSSKGIEAKEIDLEKGEISEQGPFDMVVWKVTHLLTAEQSNPSAREKLEKLRRFEKQNPNLLIFDRISRQEIVNDREATSKILYLVENELSGMYPVKIPRYVRIDRKEENYTRLLDSASVRFPVVWKTLIASGDNDCHKMGLAFSEESLHSNELQPPVILQEFKNHDGIVFKAYLFGDAFHIQPRTSLPNFSIEEKGLILFTGQSVNKNTQVDESSLPPKTVLEAISNSLKKHMKLTMFGFDVIKNSETGDYFIVDVNYFPGYKGLKTFPEMFTDFLLANAPQRDASV